MYVHLIKLAIYDIIEYVFRKGVTLNKIQEIFNSQKNKIFESYQTNEYQITYSNNENTILITYNNIQYKIEVIKIDNDYYWHLSPYNNSYFRTNLYNPNSFDIVLFAIKENDLLYKNKNK